MAERMQIHLKNDLSELMRLAQALESFGEENQLTEQEVLDFNLSLDELVTNAISYGFGDGGEHSIRLGLWLDGDWLRAELKDDGKPFNPLEIAPPDLSTDLEERNIGGLGVYFVRELMDEMVYRRHQGHNVLTLAKRRSIVEPPSNN